jgi:hypothetical protein
MSRRLKRVIGAAFSFVFLFSSIFGNPHEVNWRIIMAMGRHHATPFFFFRYGALYKHPPEKIPLNF